MNVYGVEHEKRYFFLFVILLASCLTPFLGNAQVFQPSNNYPLSDYDEFGMLFTPLHQKTVENLTKQLLEKERSAGYFGGDHQEYTIREKVKRHVAMSRGLCDKTVLEKDGVKNQARRMTNEYFTKWREQMPEVTDTAAIRAQEAKRYQQACGIIKDQEDAREDYEQRRRAPKQYTPEQLQTIYDAFQRKHGQIDAIQSNQARRSCEEYCMTHKFTVDLTTCLDLCRQIK